MAWPVSRSQEEAVIYSSAELAQKLGQLRRKERLAGGFEFFRAPPAVAVDCLLLDVIQIVQRHRAMADPEQEIGLGLPVMSPIETELNLPVPHRIAQAFRLGCYPGLFPQLAAGGLGCVFAGVDAAAHRDPERMRGVGWIEPVQEQDPAVLIDDEHPRGTAVLSTVVAHAGTLYLAADEASGGDPAVATPSCPPRPPRR
jgi:hypothetical protein